MKALYSLFRDQDAALEAVELLRVAGVSDRVIIVRSGEPLDDCEFGRGDAGTWLPWITTAGGAVGLGVGTWLPRATAASWPILTGGIPAASWWPNLIIMFELTMLGGIIAAVVTLLVTAGLPNWKPKLYDPAVSDGKILVGVVDPPSDSVSAIERALGSSARVVS
jgi:molybdopterin-containing oxidoreductase family membrane subunit